MPMPSWLCNCSGHVHLDWFWIDLRFVDLSGKNANCPRVLAHVRVFYPLFCLLLKFFSQSTFWTKYCLHYIAPWIVGLNETKISWCTLRWYVTTDRRKMYHAQESKYSWLREKGLYCLKVFHIRQSLKNSLSQIASGKNKANMGDSSNFTQQIHLKCCFYFQF